MKIVITKDEMIDRFGRRILNLSAKGQREISIGLEHGGRKTRTAVRKALKEQTSAKPRFISDATRSFLQSPLSYVIAASGSGFPLEAFNHHVKDSARIRRFWSSREHWKFQERSEGGRFGKIKMPKGYDRLVSAKMWGSKIAFVRSFGTVKGPRQQRVANARAVRTLFGPSPSKELIKGQSVAAFESGVKSNVLNEIERRLAALLVK